MFKKKPILKVVEVEMPRKAPFFSKEIKESLASLAGHPGFEYLLDRLKFEQAVLSTKLKKERHANLSDVEFLQSGIYWCGWVKEQLDKAVFKPEARRLDIMPEELATFNDLPPLPETVEVVGE